ncbi:BSP-domain-containing protein [Piromyces finnis]|uniref:BSP-domain-containing protein n=1 Tax=Piromyces finnis TaxID=1754191 RepID=A0A1Y1V910_9FUNG|nr:BSP-domain-containing protein [Piromyces finnis]|eukprot:ORX50268.1 BSP-domain-containing protein [Piromyces finnis]
MTSVNYKYKLNSDKYDNNIHYIFEYRTDNDNNGTSEKALNFLPVFFELFNDPLDEFIGLSNKVFETLYPNQENSRSNDNVKKIKQITYVVRDMDGVAYTTNDFDNYTAEIHLSIGYIFDYYKHRAKNFHSIRKNNNDSSQSDSTATVTKIILKNPDGVTETTVITTTVVTTIVSKKDIPNVTLEQEAMNELRYEVRGVLSHELVHVWQFSCDGLSGNLIEGIADAVRLMVGYPAKHWVENIVPIDECNDSKNIPWDVGYDGTGFFLNWIQNNVTNTEEFKDMTFISALNKQCRYRFTNQAFKNITSHNVEDLFIYYQISLQDK